MTVRFLTKEPDDELGRAESPIGRLAYRSPAARAMRPQSLGIEFAEKRETLWT